VAFDAFLKLSGIKGDSTDDKHKDEIQVESFSFGVSNSGSAAAGGGAGAGKALVQDFAFVSHLSMAGPQLFLACATGKHFPDALVTVRSSGARTADFYTIKLSDVLVSSYAESGTPSTDALPMDQVTFNFAKIEISFTSQNPKGGAGETTTASWDQRQNKGG
jgi:type VI secretion system secreted protein Hcp